MSLHAAMHRVLLATRGHGLGGALRAWVVALAAVSAVQCAARAAVAQLSRRSASRAFLCWRDRLGVTRVRLRVAARYIGRRLCRGFTAWSAMLDARQQLRRTVRGAAKRLLHLGLTRSFEAWELRAAALRRAARARKGGPSRRVEGKSASQLLAVHINRLVTDGQVCSGGHLRTQI